MTKQQGGGAGDLTSAFFILISKRVKNDSMRNYVLIAIADNGGVSIFVFTHLVLTIRPKKLYMCTEIVMYKI